MTNNPYIGLDGSSLSTGMRIEVVANYPGSEVDHYHGMAGHIRHLAVSSLGKPCVVVHLEGIDGEVILYPHEVMREVNYEQ